MASVSLATPSTYFNFVGVVPKRIHFKKVNAGDFVVFPDAGVSMAVANLYTGAADTYTFATCTVNNSGTAYGTTDTSIVIQALADANGGIITRTQFPFIVETTSGELMLVTNDSTPTASTSTWTVTRGAFGTTASATGLANTNTLYIKNILIFATGTGSAVVWYIPLPSDPGVKMT